MTEPYALLSDVHFHAWSQFSKVDADGINTRLSIICDEVSRAADELLEAGGDRMFIAGDLFHVRGEIRPSVMVPVIYTFKDIIDRGIKIHAIPGNHDLENKTSDVVGNAIKALEGPGFQVNDDPVIVTAAASPILMIPWTPDLSELTAYLNKMSDKLGDTAQHTDVIIHAPVDGALTGIPDSGLKPNELADMGFKRVFAGHYHNHVDFGDGIYSIGALAHQTFSDVGTRAGFLLVHPDEVVWRSSQAPMFIDFDFTAGADTEDFLEADGNYVRVRAGEMTASEIKKLREDVYEAGAKGVVIHAQERRSVSRSGSSVKTGASIEESVAGFIKDSDHDDKKALTALCLDILGEARAAE